MKKHEYCRSPRPLSNANLGSIAMGIICLVLLSSAFIRAHAVTVFDGSKKIIIRITDSMQPAMNLEERVHRLAGDNNSIMVVKLFGRFTGVGYDENGNFVVNPLRHAGRDSWLDPDHLKATIEEAKDMHCNGGDCDVILFAPSGIGDPQTFVADTNDIEQLNEAIRRVEFMCERIVEAGVDLVFWCNNSFAFYHERFPMHTLKVIKEFNNRNTGKPYKALDIMSATKAEYPMGNNFDLFHPISYTRQLTSHLYFQALCENDGIEVPSWSEEMIAEAKARDMEDYEQVRYLGPRSGKYKLGDTIWVEWEADESVESIKGPSICFIRTDTLVEKLLSSYNFVHHFMPEDINSRRTHFRDTSQYWGRFPYVVNESTFDFGKTRMECPVPVIISLGYNNLLGHCSYPYIENPDSMIILYPYETITPDAPIYPEAFYGSVSVSSPNSKTLSSQSASIRVEGKTIRIASIIAGSYEVRMTDTRGRTCFRKRVGLGKKHVVSLPQIATGVYMVSLHAAGHDGDRPVAAMPVLVKEGVTK